MNITPSNYASSTKGMTIPSRLKEGHDYVLENADLYDLDNDIKSLIDLHIKEVSKIAQEKKIFVVKPSHGVYPKSTATTEKAKPMKKQPVKVKAAATVIKKAFMKEPPLPSRSEVTPDVSIIKMWLSFNKKEKTKPALLAFIKKMQKSIADKAIRATSKYAEVLRDIQTAATVQYNGLEEGETIRINFKPSTIKKYTDIIGNASVYKSLNLIKRFISLQGSNDAAKINRLLFAFKKTKLAKDDPYKKEIDRLQKLLSGNIVNVSKQELAGLEGILNSCNCNHNDELGLLDWNSPVQETQDVVYTPAAAKAKPTNTSKVGVSDSLFVKASDTSVSKKSADTFRLGGEIGNFMGDLQQYKLAIALSGDTHAGKTQFEFQLAEAFMNIGKAVGIFDLEQGGMQSKDTQDAVKQWISKKNIDKLSVAPEAPKGIDTIREYAHKFDVVFIDSWQKLKIPNTQFDSLRIEFPNTIFVVIFQQNAEGTTRGGNSSEYDANVQIKVVNVDDSKKNNYALMIKNRGNKIGTKYNWATQKMVA